MQKILILSIFLLTSGWTYAQSDSKSQEEAVVITNTTGKTDFEGYMRVSPNPGKGYFFMFFNLPTDIKKLVWTISDEDGRVLVKEKYKNLKAGENKIGYNYKNAPDGLHTFTLTSDTYVISRKVDKVKE